MWALTIPFTEFRLIPLVLQYLLKNHELKVFAPLLALHEIQHLTIFSSVTTLASLMICSQDPLVFPEMPNTAWQYTQDLSRAKTMLSIFLGIPHLFFVLPDT